MLNKHNFNVAKCASRETSRFTLNGILVTPEHTVASDGHKLIAVTTPKGRTVAEYPVVENAPGEPVDTWKPFVMPTAAALELAKATPSKEKIPILNHAVIYSKTNDNGSAYIGVTDLERPQFFAPRKIEGNFPDWERVCPKAEDTRFNILLDAYIVRDLMDQYIGASTNREKKQFVRWSFTGSGNAVRLDAKVGDDQDMMGLIMPGKLADDEVRDLPQFGQYPSESEVDDMDTDKMRDMLNASLRMREELLADLKREKDRVCELEREIESTKAWLADSHRKTLQAETAPAADPSKPRLIAITDGRGFTRYIPDPVQP